MHANETVDLHGMPDVHSNKLFFAIAGHSVHTQSHGKNVQGTSDASHR